MQPMLKAMDLSLKAGTNTYSMTANTWFKWVQKDPLTAAAVACYGSIFVCSQLSKAAQQQQSSQPPSPEAFHTHLWGSQVPEAFDQVREVQELPPPVPEHIDLAAAGQMGILCNISYFPGVEEQLSASGFQLVSHFANEEKVVYGFLARRGDSLFLVFRGTIDPSEEGYEKNVMADLDVRPSVEQVFPDFPLPEEAVVVRGFVECYKAVQDQVLSAVASQIQGDSPPSSIQLSGHSLGGAMAQLAAMEIRQLHPQLQVELCTFGAPRAGNQVFAEVFKGLFTPPHKNIQVQSDHDIIPRMPLMAFGYVHPACHIIGTQPSLLEEEDTDSVFKFVGNPMSYKDVMKVPDYHTIDFYIDSLSSIQKQEEAAESLLPLMPSLLLKTMRLVNM